MSASSDFLWIAGIAMCLVAAGCSGSPTAELIKQLESSDVETRRTAARALGELGNEASSAVPALEAAVADSDVEVRRLATYALGEVGPEAKSVLPALTAALKDEQFSVRLSAAFAVQKLAPESEEHVPVVLEAMQMGDGGVIVEVGDMGEKATWAIPTLIGLLNDERAGIRRLAAEALGGIRPSDSKTNSALQKALRDQDDRVREAAQQALAKISPS